MTNVVSIIITIHDGEKWIDQCFDAICQQTVLSLSHYKLEVCVFDDFSADATARILQVWREHFLKYEIALTVITNNADRKLGVGFGRNRAIEKCKGSYLCFQDIDDVMYPKRIEAQMECANKFPNALIGCQFERSPINSTARYTTWANKLAPDKLSVQIFTAHGPTILMPTWLCHKSVFHRVGKFSEAGTGTPEDLIFFYDHLDVGGEIRRVDEVLLNYRYHPEATTFTINRETIWNIRLEYLINTVLITAPWTDGFTIWNAGKQGRRLYRDLPENIKLCVREFCDIDKKKIGKTYNYFDLAAKKHRRRIPIVHFSAAKKPIVICMKMNLTRIGFESNLDALNLVEGKDYILFS